MSVTKLYVKKVLKIDEDAFFRFITIYSQHALSNCNFNSVISKLAITCRCMTYLKQSITGMTVREAMTE